QYKQAVFNSKMKKVEVLMSNLSSALQEYQLIHGKGTVPSGPGDFAWQPPEGCEDQSATYSASGWPVVWICNDFMIGLTQNNAAQGTVSANLKMQGGNNGTYEKLSTGSFRCRGTSQATVESFKKYCEINNLPII
ncbi:MAG: hypothetical protein LBM71_01340, partial [Elusimicrobiota bacterium]|nr:hypothetical protein [Elusimicrobiota bacterium]